MRCLEGTPDVILAEGNSEWSMVNGELSTQWEN
jgi:hypothetical protein